MELMAAERKTTFGRLWPGLFLGLWGSPANPKRPEDYGLTPEDFYTPVCELCLWQNCDRCSLGDGNDDDPPPIRLVLEGTDYYDTLPLRKRFRRSEEDDDTVERMGDALYFARENSVVFPRSWAVLDEDLNDHPAFKIGDEEDKMSERRILVLYCDGGRRADGSTYGSVRIGCTGQVIRREFGPGTSNQAEYKALANALWVARQIVRRSGHYNTVVVRTDSDLVRNQVLGSWRVNDPKLEALKERVWEEMNKLLRALRDANDPKECTSVRLERADRAEIVRILGH